MEWREWSRGDGDGVGWHSSGVVVVTVGTHPLVGMLNQRTLVVAVYGDEIDEMMVRWRWCWCDDDGDDEVLNGKSPSWSVNGAIICTMVPSLAKAMPLWVEWCSLVGVGEIAEEKLASICSERVRLEDLLRKANSDYHGDGKFVELQEKYVQVFKDPISFDVGMNSVDGDDGDDDDGDGNGDDDGTHDDDARGDSDVNRDDDNADSRNDDDVGGDGNGNDDDGGCKSIEKQVDATTKEVDAHDIIRKCFWLKKAVLSQSRVHLSLSISG
ncbi:hypothetical protein Tco_0610150 [Tanacetum coccineum]